jgi:hypothetical protein
MVYGLVGLYAGTGQVFVPEWASEVLARAYPVKEFLAKVFLAKVRLVKVSFAVEQLWGQVLRQ